MTPEQIKICQAIQEKVRYEFKVGDEASDGRSKCIIKSLDKNEEGYYPILYYYKIKNVWITNAIDNLNRLTKLYTCEELIKILRDKYKEELAKYFYRTMGIDIDKKAVNYAWNKFGHSNLAFEKRNILNNYFFNNTFDVVICNHIYEHVSNPHKMMSEIYRVLKPGGICYFAAGNRLNIIEGHYGLPFLSVMPKWMGHLYLRITGKGTNYYENHLTVWGLRKLVKNIDYVFKSKKNNLGKYGIEKWHKPVSFEIIDYTKKIINDPEKFSATDMVRQGSWKQKIAKFILAYFYWLFPTYIWILKKE